MIAIISDIHANLEALTTVLEDIKTRGIKEIYCLGDVIYLGPNPLECLELLRKISKFILCGASEKYAMEGYSIF